MYTQYHRWNRVQTIRTQSQRLGEHGQEVKDEQQQQQQQQQTDDDKAVHVFELHREKVLGYINVIRESVEGETCHKMMIYIADHTKYVPGKGLECDGSISTLRSSVYGVLWNNSYSSRKISKDMVEAGIVKISVDTLATPWLEEPKVAQDVHYLLLGCLSILANMARICDERRCYEEANLKEVLKPYLACEETQLKAVAVQLLSSILTEEENSMLEDTGAIPYMIECLRNATIATNRLFRGFTPTELAECLERLAVNDSNKKTIVDGGALPSLVNMLTAPDEEEQIAATKALWTLAFDDVIRRQIQDEAGCVQGLEDLTNSDKESVKNAAKGALWIINEHHKKAATPVPPSGEDVQKQHVFISYSWANQPEVIQIKDRLKADGFRVWFDKEQMGGSTMDAMAEAVENAAVVLVCMSEQYKARPKTRSEAEYTFEQQKPFIPLMMQRHYKADGWLGLLLGSKFYINFDGKYEFEEAYTMLLRELKGRGQGQAATAGVVACAGAAPVAPAPPKQPAVADWSNKKVESWLESHDLSGLLPKLRGFDGKRLARLNKIRGEAPEFFYKYLSSKLELDTVEIVDFTEGLASL